MFPRRPIGLSTERDPLLPLLPWGGAGVAPGANALRVTSDEGKLVRLQKPFIHLLIFKASIEVVSMISGSQLCGFVAL